MPDTTPVGYFNGLDELRTDIAGCLRTRIDHAHIYSGTPFDPKQGSEEEFDYTTGAVYTRDGYGVLVGMYDGKVYRVTVAVEEVDREASGFDRPRPIT